MMHTKQQIDKLSDTFEIVSAISAWILPRHQWLIEAMRCALTGERMPTTQDFIDFDQLMPESPRIAKHTSKTFTSIKKQLKQTWLKATKAIHPMSGLTLFEQLSTFQSCANDFIVTSNEVNHQLLQDLAMRDALTGAYTRLSLTQHLENALQQSAQSEKPSCIAFLDQNGFKQVNDQWGHTTGDLVLMETAELIRNNIRNKDMLFRYGGDEWLILFPETNLSDVTQVMQRMQAIYESHTFYTSDGQAFQTSFSMGIVASTNQHSPQSWIEAVDHAYYQKK